MTVLVVDDTDSAREIAERILRHHGLNAIGVQSAPAALTLLEQFTPDLILLDLAMPEMDGLTLLDHLRKQPQWSQIPVVMLSAISDEQMVRRALQLGARDYLVKAQFDAPQMLEVVMRHARHQ